MSFPSILVVVDMQYDFFPGGSLAVAKSDEILPAFNRCIDLFDNCAAPLFFMRNWHPAGTAHFKSGSGDRPGHCVQRTRGAAFHEALHIPGRAVAGYEQSKGEDSP